MKKVSVIVPAYNAEKTLEKCVISILNQTYHDLEIIIVDDGSTDGTLEVARHLQSSDKRIQSVHKENGGVSSARNFGMKYAQGDYIAFVDSDDWLKTEMIEKLMLGSCADVVVCFIEQKMYKCDLKQKSEVEFFDLNGIAEKFDLLYIANFFNSVCGKIYKREVINGVAFEDKVRCGEDLLFNFQVFALAKRIAIVNYAGYVYVNNVYSATHRFNVEDFEQQKKLRDAAVEFERKVLRDGRKSPTIDTAYLRNTTDIIANLVTFETNDNTKKYLQEYLQDPYFINVSRRNSLDSLNIDAKRKIFLWMMQNGKFKLLCLMGRINKVRNYIKKVKTVIFGK